MRRDSLFGSGWGVRPFGEAKVTSWPAERSLESGLASSGRKKPVGCSWVPVEVLCRGKEVASLRIMRTFLGGILSIFADCEVVMWCMLGCKCGWYWGWCEV